MYTLGQLFCLSRVMRGIAPGSPEPSMCSKSNQTKYGNPAKLLFIINVNLTTFKITVGTSWQVLGKAVKYIKTVLPLTPTQQICITLNAIQSWSPNKVQMLSKKLNMNYSDVNETVVRKKEQMPYQQIIKEKYPNFINKIQLVEFFLERKSMFL